MDFIEIYGHVCQSTRILGTVDFEILGEDMEFEND